MPRHQSTVETSAQNPTTGFGWLGLLFQERKRLRRWQREDLLVQKDPGEPTLLAVGHDRAKAVLRQRPDEVGLLLVAPRLSLDSTARNIAARNIDFVTGPLTN